MTFVPLRRRGPTADANAGAKNGIHHLRTTAPGANRSRCTAVRRQEKNPIESSSDSVGKFGRAGAGKEAAWVVARECDAAPLGVQHERFAEELQLLREPAAPGVQRSHDREP